MNKKFIYMTGILFSMSLLLGCDNNIEPTVPIDNIVNEAKLTDSDSSVEEGDNEESNTYICELEDGVYLADFDTDGSMFHVNEMCNGKGELTVSEGKMIIHISLPSKSILNLYCGLADDAQKEGAILIDPTVDIIDYNDGTSEEVHGFDIPVPYLEDEFDVALVGTKGKWYDHKVSVSNPVKKEASDSENNDYEDNGRSIENGDYTIEVSLEGGTGKATISSPSAVKKTDDGYILVVEWNSPHYDYMIVNDVKYLPVNEEGNSVFEIPVSSLEGSVDVVADTVAMSKPHEIEYKITFNPDSLKEEK